MYGVLGHIIGANNQHISALPTFATWDDVQDKALRLLNDNKLHQFTESPEEYGATVQGDHGIYRTTLQRQSPANRQITGWSCECPWGQNAFNRQYDYVGRVCSHAMALLNYLYSDRYRHYDPEGYATEEGLSSY